MVGDEWPEVTCGQRSHTEARGPLCLSLVGWFCSWPSAVFPPAHPWPCAQALLSAPAPPGQRLADVTMSSWGGVSWQVPSSPWSCGRCMSQPWARRLSNLPSGLLPCKEATLPTS